MAVAATSPRGQDQQDENVEVTCHDFREYFELIDVEGEQEEDADISLLSGSGSNVNITSSGSDINITSSNVSGSNISSNSSSNSKGMDYEEDNLAAACFVDTSCYRDLRHGAEVGSRSISFDSAADDHMSEDIISMGDGPILRGADKMEEEDDDDDDRNEKTMIGHPANVDEGEEEEEEEVVEDGDGFLSASPTLGVVGDSRRSTLPPTRASEYYLESCASLRSLHAAPTEEVSNLSSPSSSSPDVSASRPDDDPRDGVDRPGGSEEGTERITATAASASASAASPATRRRGCSAYPTSALIVYKSQVQQLMQRMEEEQIRVIEQLDAKSLQFQERMEELLLSPGSMELRTQQQQQQKQNQVEGQEDTSKTHGQGGAFKDDAKDGNHTVSTRSISMSSLESTALIVQEEDDGSVADRTDSTTGGTSVASITPSSSPSLQPASPSQEGGGSVGHGGPRWWKDKEQEMQQEMGDLECENRALRALRESYQNRFAFEQKEKAKLQRQLADLQATLEEQTRRDLGREPEAGEGGAKHQNTEQAGRSDVEFNLQRRNDRVRRDLDKLWKEYKALQTLYKDAQATIHGMENRADESDKQERQWKKENTYMKEKLDFLREKVAAVNGTLSCAQEGKARAENMLEKLQVEQQRLQQENMDLCRRLEERNEKGRQARLEKHRVKRENQLLGGTAHDEAVKAQELESSCRSLLVERDALQDELIEMGEALRKAYSL